MAEKPKGPQPRTLMDVEKSLAAIHQKFGLESVRRMSADARESMPVFPTGSLSVDMATGIGGWPRGRIVEVYGPESAGKTTLCLHAIAEAQAAGGVCMFIDAEHALDPTYASAIGVHMEDLLVSQPDHGEQALGIAEEFISSGSGALVVIDSVAALVPEAELLGEMGQLHVGLQARLMSQALRKITGVAKRTNTTVMFINQIRHKIGVLYGSPETTPGGNALKFYASMRVDVRRKEQTKDAEGGIQGNFMKVKFVKNKCAPPFKECEVEIVFGQGIDRFGDIMQVGVATGVIERKGSSYSARGERLGQGRAKVLENFAKNPEMLAGILADIRALK